MRHDWKHVIRRLGLDHRSGASALLFRGIEAARLFLTATRQLRPEGLERSLGKFTLRLTASQPSMAPFLTLANALWLGLEREGDRRPAWERLHAALGQYAGVLPRNLRETVRRTASVVRRRSLVLTYSNSTAVRLALWEAMAAGRRFEVVCSESRPVGEGVALARRLADLGIPVHLVVDAALIGWIERADLVLLGADAIVPHAIVNKAGTAPLLEAAHRAKVPAFVLADSSKWLPAKLAVFRRQSEQPPGEITPLRHPNLVMHNLYFDSASPSLITGLVWEGGVAKPREIQRRLARLPSSHALVGLLEKHGAAKGGSLPSPIYIRETA